MRNIKFYSRLRESAFRGGLLAAQQLGMSVTAHVARSEMLLLDDAGIPMSGVFPIATRETAIGIGHGSVYARIETGRRADMIVSTAIRFTGRAIRSAERP